MTTIVKSERNVCVPDACSLLFAGQVELKSKEVLEWLLERYDIYIPPTVKIECFNAIQRDSIELINEQKFKNHISQRTLSDRMFGHCVDYLTDYCNKFGVSEFSEQHPGEMECLALCVYLNAQLGKPITFLTDDFAAIDSFAQFINDQKFAIQMCVPDIIINIFKTDLSVDENETSASLQTYYNIMKQAMQHKIFKARFNQSCRTVWFQKCASMCVI